MAKNLKINIKNTQLAEALNLNKLKKKVDSAKKKTTTTMPKAKKAATKEKKEPLKPKPAAAPKRKARILPDVEKEEKKKLIAEGEAAEKEAVKRAPTRKAKIIEPEEKKVELEAEVGKKVEEKEPLQKMEKSEERQVEKAEDLDRKKALAKEKKPSGFEKGKPRGKEETNKPPTPATEASSKESALKSKKKKKVIQSSEDIPIHELFKGGFKEFKEFKHHRRGEKSSFDSRDRMGLRDSDESRERWRKKRAHQKAAPKKEEEIQRPKHLHIRLPIVLKDLASEMKIKASEIIAKFFKQGMVLTLNEILDDETTVQLIGNDFDCEITIDTSEEKRLRITENTIKEEIKESDVALLQNRPPIITFMGHVDHGKTSLIDAIRKSNIAASEAGAITQHIGAFTAVTASGDLITILDTPGHEAFTEMRHRGATVTDLVVLVVAGDEGMRDQTIEAMTQAKEAKVPIIVAINKSDKAGFDPEKVYRQLADHELLPEAWGGETITVNCSAIKNTGIDELLEMIALQSEVLELKADPSARARGTVLESEMHKGMGATATLLVQNGTLKEQDAIVFGTNWGRIKTMHDQFGKVIKAATPSMPAKITGLSDLAEAGCEFIVVSNEKEARSLSEARKEKEKEHLLALRKKKSLEALFDERGEKAKKIMLPIILRADVQGSLEALQTSLMKIHSDKIDLNIVSAEVGEISESDIELAAASKAIILGFHTRIESHAESLIKELKVTILDHNIIYHAIDDVKEQMRLLLPKLEKELDFGEAKVIALFKSSKLGVIAGCIVTDGIIKRNHHIRVNRNGEIIWKGKIASIKRVHDEVKEVQKGVECGIVLDGFNTSEIDDIIEAYEITYEEQKL